MQKLGTLTVSPHPEINTAAGAITGDLMLEEAYCGIITSRIIIVSPLPQLIHELIRGLSAACYDVMVFHHGDPELLPRLQAGLLVVDRTRADGHEGFEWLGLPEVSAIPVLQLVKPGSEAAAVDGALEWPAPFPKALEAVRSRVAASQAPSASASVSAAKTNPISSSHSFSAASAELRLKDLSLDLKRYAAYTGNSRIDLTKTEFELLRALLEAEGSVLSRQELMDRVWGSDYFGGSNTVDVHMKSLRHKLGDDPKLPRYIITVRGIGYRAADG